MSCELKDILPGQRFQHDGSTWIRLAPEETGYEKQDLAMSLGQEAEIDVADGGVVSIWCARLSRGPGGERGGLRPLFETTLVSPIVWTTV